jgi:hypothetical protein
MGSFRQSKSSRVRSARPVERLRTRQIRSNSSNRTPAGVVEIPPEVLAEIENQRSVLVTVITLLHCLHVVLQQQEASIDSQIDRRMEAAASWASLPEMTAMLLERTHAVLFALDSTNVTKAVKAFES